MAAVEDVNAPPPNVWTTGLCWCVDDISSCVEGGACLPCFMSVQCSRMQTPEAQGCSFPWCVVSGCFPLCSAFYLRSKIRSRYNISEGDCCTDCLAAFLCPCCAATQTYREMSHRGEWPGGIVCVKSPFVARTDDEMGAAAP